VSCQRVTRRMALQTLLLLLLPTLGACGDAVTAARGSCVEASIGERRCQAIVAEAASRMDGGRPPLIGVRVELATPADRTTLRAQQLVALVRFAFLDGSTQEVQVFCTRRPEPAAVCAETQQ
jgi:hypothetical protein